MPSRIYTDQMGEIISCPFPPKRIISLVPSQTELLAYFGLNEEVVGITKFCVHPLGWADNKSWVGGTKGFNFAVIDSLKPDLIIGNKEENYKEGIDALKRKYPVWMSDISTLDQALEMIEMLGRITGREKAGTDLTVRIKRSFLSLEKVSHKKVLYLIWKKPWMAAGSDTFIDEMLQKIGLVNVVRQRRYPVLTEEEIANLKPDFIFLSSEPYPFKAKHLDEMKAINPQAHPILVDGEMFSWYGSRLLYACDYFRSLPLDS